MPTAYRHGLEKVTTGAPGTHRPNNLDTNITRVGRQVDTNRTRMRIFRGFLVGGGGGARERAERLGRARILGSGARLGLGVCVARAPADRDRAGVPDRPGELRVRGRAR